MSAVRYDVRDSVAILTLNRPESLNALNLAMIAALRETTARAAFDPAVRAVVVCGAGEHFMAGGDLKWFREQLALPPAERQPAFEQVIGDVRLDPDHLRCCRGNRRMCSGALLGQFGGDLRAQLGTHDHRRLVVDLHGLTSKNK